MPLDREQFNQFVDLLLPYVIDEADRQPLIERGFYGEKIVASLDYTGKATTFAPNCIRNLQDYNGDAALIQLLETLHKHYLGPEKQTDAQTLITQINPTSATSSSESFSSDEHHVFISYSRRDIGFVDRLRSDLGAHHIPYWIDKEGLTPGTRNWERSIREAIRQSYAIVWVVSPASYESEYVNSEIAVSEMYERKIYPVWADGENWIACVPLGKHNIQFVDMRGDAYLSGLAQLVAALGSGQSDSNHPEAKAYTPEAVPPLPPGIEPKNPYKGLQAFQEDDQEKFYGREALVANLVDRLKSQLAAGQERFLAVLGPSGAGKSSVVMAGLIPELKRSEAWTHLPTIVPGTHPIEHLADALKAAMPDTSLATIEADLNSPGGRMLHRLVRPLPGAQVVLYIDQFEELFTLTKDDGERNQFINLITEAVSEPDGKLIVLLSMRADFLDQPLNYPQLGALFNKYTELVQPMSIAELRDAIEKPARLPDVRLRFDAGLVAEIIFELRSRDKALAGALPLLQFTLERLYEERDGTRLTTAAYENMGGVAGAIGTHSETVFSQLPEQVQDKLGQVFLPLVNIDEETGEPTRRRASYDELTRDPDAKKLVDVLVKNRLLQAGHEGGNAYLEIAHEALFRSWERLVNWVADVKGDLYLLREMRKAAQIWDERKRNRDFLWLGERGADVQAMRKRLKPDLNDVERAFARPEAEHLLDEIADIDTLHPRRSEISTRLHQLNYTLPGAGLREDGLPDIVWCYVDVPEELRGETIEFIGDEGKFGEFEVAPFYIAKYLVTHVQFQAFVDHPNGFSNPDWWRDMPEGYQQQEIKDARQPYTNYPRDSVSWYQAVAFCRWLSNELGEEIRLPTEWEWQWAAQNGTEQREYPWKGGQWDGRRCNTKESGIGRSTAVGMFPDGEAACGAFDLAGNLYEWCLNKYDMPIEIAVDDTEARRVLRGGSWDGSYDFARAVYRLSYDPFSRDFSFGFRLCRPLRARDIVPPLTHETMIKHSDHQHRAPRLPR